MQTCRWTHWVTPVTGNGAYDAHAALVDPARPRSQLWRLGFGILMIGAIMLGLGTALDALLASLPQGAGFAADLPQGDRPATMLVLLGSFAFLIIAVNVTVRVLHNRSLRSVIGAARPARTQFLRVATALVGLGAALLLLPPYGMDDPLLNNLPLATWLLLLPLSLAAVLVQTSAEEILFRGYIQQALAARFRSPWVWMGLPAVLFALGHYLPVEAGENAVLIAAWAGLFSILMADLTARSGTLGPAIAVHFFNNVVALLILSVPDSLNGLALYTVPYAMSDTQDMRGWLAVDFGMMLVSWLTARLAIRR